MPRQTSRHSARYSTLIIVSFIALGASGATTARPMRDSLSNTPEQVSQLLSRSPAITGPATAEPIQPGENGAHYELGTQDQARGARKVTLPSSRAQARSP